jgi:hypothetical protein
MTSPLTRAMNIYGERRGKGAPREARRGMYLHQLPNVLHESLGAGANTQSLQRLGAKRQHTLCGRRRRHGQHNHVLSTALQSVHLGHSGKITTQKTTSGMQYPVTP